MASFLAKTISKRILGERAANNFGKDDPIYEYGPELDRRGNPTGKTVKRKKGFPPGISENDKKVLNKVRRRAHVLDKSMSICGIRFGWSSLIGIIPAIGDLLDVFMALMVLRTCEKVDGKLDPLVRSKMVMNIIIDGLIGFVPFLGDIADALFRANTRNCTLLENFLTERGRRNMEAQKASLAITSEQSPRSNTVSQPSHTNMQYPRGNAVSDDDPPPRYENSFSGHQNSSQTSPTRPEPAKLNRKKTTGGSWLSRFTKTQDTLDLERGDVATVPPLRPGGRQ